MPLGSWGILPKRCHSRLHEVIETTKGNQRMTLTLALSYGGRASLIEAMQSLAQKAKAGEIDPAKIDEKMVSQHLNTWPIPDPELLIRTSGEYRISNFLLWEIALYRNLYHLQTMARLPARRPLRSDCRLSEAGTKVWKD